MDITAQQKALFEQKYPFSVEFILDSDRVPSIKLRFFDKEQYINEMYTKSPFVTGFTIDFNGKMQIVKVTKAKVLYYKFTEE